MGLLFIVLMIAGGVIVYRYLVTIEAEIRAEIAQAEQASSSPEEHEVRSQSGVIELIRTHPGILQKELYQKLPGLDRRAIQKELLDLDRSGKISRRKSGNCPPVSRSGP